MAHSRAAEIAKTAKRVTPAVGEMTTKRGIATRESVVRSGASGAPVLNPVKAENAPDHANVRKKGTKPLTKKIVMNRTAHQVHTLRFYP